MMRKRIKILAIETSCDETAASVIEEMDGQPVIISNIVSSQVDLHAKTGGVVPEVASRAHMEAINPVIALALLNAQQKIYHLNDKSNYNSENLDSRSQTPVWNDMEDIDYQKSISLLDDITHIAVTAGPGLIGSLLVGFNAAKAMAYARDLPIVPVNHIEGHIYSVFLKLQNNRINGKMIKWQNDKMFPLLALTVSGGHTSLNVMSDHGIYETIGDTLDDAVGEAYDKVGKLLGLGYPGGPAVSKLAKKFRENLKSNPNGKILNDQINSKIVKCQNSKMLSSNIVFPRPMITDGTFNFSFSGLKTAVLTAVKKNMTTYHVDNPEDIPGNVKEGIAYAFEEAVADVLVAKTLKAIDKFSPKTVIFAGGVSANDYLRLKLSEAVDSQSSDINYLVPTKELTGDNAAMIGLAAYYNIKNGKAKAWSQMKIDANWELEQSIV